MRSEQGLVLNNVPLFLQSENYNSQETARRRGTASLYGPAPSPPSGPAFQLVPSPPSECVSVTQRRSEAEGPSGGAAAAASSSSTSRAARSGLPRALRERITKRAPRLSLRPRLVSAQLRGQLPLAGLGRLARKAAAERRAVCSRSPRTHTSPPRPGSRGRAGIPATSNCPVSVAAARRGRGRHGAGEGCGPGGRATSSAASRGGRPGLGGQLSPPACAPPRRSGVCGALIPRLRRRKRLCQEPARRALPLRPGTGARRPSPSPAPRAGPPAEGGELRGGGERGRIERETKGGGGLFFCLYESDNFFFLLYITQTSKLVILFIVMIIVIITACPSRFLSSVDLRALKNTN